MNFYDLYRASIERILTPQEAEQLQEWQQAAPYFALPHLAQTRGQARTDDFFRAAIYAPDRRQWQQHVRGRLYWPRLDPAPKPPMDPQTPSSSRPQSIRPGFMRHSPLFVALELSAPLHPPKAQDLAFRAESPTLEAQPYLQQIISERVYLYQGQVSVLRAALSRFRATYQPEPFEASGPEQYFTSEIPGRRQRSADLIDQFLAEKPARRRPRPEDTPAPPPQQIEALSQQIERSTAPDQNLATETLAQLNLRQGNPAEAIRIYEQLRLRFPDKSAYFDAQIGKISQH